MKPMNKEHITITVRKTEAAEMIRLMYFIADLKAALEAPILMTL